MVNIISVILAFFDGLEGNIVDLGCGIPFLCRSLDKIWPGYVTGIDLVAGKYLLIVNNA